MLKRHLRTDHQLPRKNTGKSGNFRGRILGGAGLRQDALRIGKKDRPRAAAG